MIEWLLYGLLALVALVTLLILSPRFKGGKNAPPLVTDSTVVPIPLFGVIAEFFKSPNTMIKRCYRDYGPVFTIPVSEDTRMLLGVSLLFFLTGIGVSVVIDRIRSKSLNPNPF